MALFTSTQSGNWNQAATWGGAGVPGDGDTAVKSDTHEVTITEDVTIGLAPASTTDAITCLGEGDLIVQAVNLVVKGGITIHEGSFIANNTNITVPVATGVVYKFSSVDYNIDTAHFIFNGTVSSPCSVTKTGDGTFQITTYPNYLAVTQAEYTTFTGLGDATNFAIYTRRGGLVFTNCIIDTCWTIGNAITYLYPGSEIVFSYSRFKGSQGTWDTFIHNQTVAALTPGTRRTIDNCSFEKGPQTVYNVGDFTVSNCYIPDFISTGQTRLEDYIPAWDTCFLHSNDAMNMRSPIVRDCYRFVDDEDNAHGLVFDDMDDFTTLLYTGIIGEHGGDWSLNEPDFILNIENQSNALEVTIEKVLVLPNAAGRSGFRLFTDLCSFPDNLVWKVKNCTAYGDDRGGGLLAAHGTGEAGRLAEFINNLFWSEAGPTDAEMLSIVGDAVPANNYCTLVNNNAFNVVTTSYDVIPAAFASTPGTNDVENVDIQFVDRFRDFASWSETVLGNTGTDAQLKAAAIASLQAMNDTGDAAYNEDATVLGLMTWVKAGLTPQNTAELLTAGYGGTYIGAVEPAVASEEQMTKIVGEFIEAATVAYSNIQDVSATSRVLGRKTAGAGSVEELTKDELLALLSIANSDDTKEATGFVNRTDSDISKTDGTLQFTIAPAVTSFDYYIKGVKYTKTGTENVNWTDVEGLHFFYYDGATLTHSATWSNGYVTDMSFVALIYWDATNNVAFYMGDERHGISMSGATHLFMHQKFGAGYLSGLTPGNLTVNDSGDVNAHAQLSVSNGSVCDEDITHTITDGAPQELSTIAEIPILYRLGAAGDWRIKTADTFPIIYDGTAGYDPSPGVNDRVPFNEWTGSTWQLTEVTSDNNFTYVHIIATNDVTNPIMGIQGQSEYGTLVAARNNVTTEVNALLTAGLPFAEFVLLYTFIFQTNDDGYTNTPHAKIVSYSATENYADWRKSNISQTTSPADHAQLGGLDYDAAGHIDFERDAWESTSNPGVTNDNADTAGIGRIFQVSEQWVNTTTDEVYSCVDSTAGAAVWVQSAGVAQTGYAVFSNLSTDRTCDANATTTEELADILGTLIEDLKVKGIVAT